MMEKVVTTKMRAMTTISSIIENPRVLRDGISPFFLRGVCPRPVLRQRLFLVRLLPAISGLSLASFIACYAEGGDSIVGNVTG
jgi:hypothetical protein